MEEERENSVPDFHKIAEEFPKQFWELVNFEFKMLKDNKIVSFNDDLLLAMETTG